MSASSEPLVTVISLCYGTAGFVIEAIESLQRQTYPKYELLIVDDASPDDSVSVLRDWMEQSGTDATLIVNERNLGIPGALNRGIEAARGELVTWLSDDLWDPSRLARVVSAFAECPDRVGVVFGDAVIIDEHGTPTGQVLSPPASLAAVGFEERTMAATPQGSTVILPGAVVRQAMFRRCFIPAPTATVRRPLYDDVGRYDESVAIEDLDFWLRASAHTDFAYVRAPLANYRLHASNFTSGRTEAYLDSLSAILRAHAMSPGERSALPRHVREEAYRVAGGLLAEGDLRGAWLTIRRHYVRNMRPSARCAKETARLVIAAASTLGRSRR